MIRKMRCQGKELIMFLSGSSVGKNPPANAGDGGFDPWRGKIPWIRKWQSCLADYSAMGSRRVRHNLVTEHHTCMQGTIIDANSWDVW